MALTKNSNRLERIAAITAGLSATGAVVGALCAVVALTAIALIEGDASWVFSTAFLRPLGVVALIGTLTGIVGAPALAWGLLRHVRLGHAMIVTAFGAVAGSILGEIFLPLNPYSNAIPGVIVGGWLGFVLAGVALRLLSRRA